MRAPALWLLAGLCASLGPPRTGLAADDAAAAGETQRASELTSLSIEQLMNVEVTTAAKKPQKLFASPFATYVITQEDIRRSGAATIPELLRMVPGMDVAQITASKWAVSARGFNSRFADKLLVLIDGRSVYSPLTSGVEWDTVDTLLEDVDRIEVIRGPGGTLWGANAVNGIVNIITKHARDTQGTFAAGSTGNLENGGGAVRFGGKFADSGYFRVFAKGFSRDNFRDLSGNDAHDAWDQGRGGFRWHHPARGLLMPADFIPIAERTGSIQAIGHWVLDKACEQMKSWRDQGIAPPLMAINLSLVQIKAGREIVRDITDSLAKWGLAPGDLELDVTESTLAQTTWAQSDVLARLRELGVKIALDDFGTEYSSFDYVRTYHVNHIKIAQWFVDLAARDPERAATIRAIINLARELDLKVIAEGVETEEQRALLTSIGRGTQGQGFYFSPPVPALQAEGLLRQKKIEPVQVVEAPAGEGGKGEATRRTKRSTVRRRRR